MTRFNRYIFSLFLLTAVTASAAGQSQEETRLLRFPHINGDKVLFTYAGDLFTAPLAGGEAKQLTTHEGLEIFGRFSPDGRWIAFSGEYAGTRQVYLIPSGGGIPKQLTFYPDVGAMPPRGGYDHLVLDWTPDGSKILVRANRTAFGQRAGRYYLVDPFNGGLEVPLEIPEGATGATFDGGGTKLTYNIKSREWRHWKRYQGGRQQDIWIYDLANHSSERLTDYTGTDNFPMWVGDTIYFISDRDSNQKLNVWACDTGSGEVSQVTRHDEFDVNWPSRGRGGIVYENGGFLYHLNPVSSTSRRIPVKVTGDRPYTTPYYANVSNRIDGFDISPSAKRAIFAARGELFSVPAEHGDIRNLTSTPGVRERDVTWSPDGKWISYISDATGEYLMYLMAADGSGEPEILTDDGGAWIFNMSWSPDSKWIAFADNKNRLRAVDIENHQITEIDQGTKSSLTDFSWSGDSGWIAYSRTGPNYMDSIWLYSFDSGITTQVTGEMTDESSPVFDLNGKYLYFVSFRDFNLQDEGFDARIFAATLRADLEHPFPPLSDEEPEAAGEEAAEETAEEQAGEEEALRIDLENLDGRIAVLPDLSAGSYRGLVGQENGLLFFSGSALQKYDLEEREAQTIIEGISGYAFTPDFKSILYRRGNNYGIVPLRPGQQNSAGHLDMEGMTLRIEPLVEWAQIYHDTWLIMRDWFYDPDMHGVDWDAMLRRYQPLLPHLAHRADLDYLQAELIAELNVGHAYVNSSPEMPRVERVDIGLLGVEFEADGRFYRISKIFPGENWHEEFRSPLTEPGIDVSVGDYLIAIDGREVTTGDNPYSFLVNKVDRIVKVTVNSRPRQSGARTYDVRPVSSEQGLRYQDWVAENTRMVEELSDGRIGYMHLPNTSIPGHRELFEGFQPLAMKEALIIDERYNGGGFIPEEMSMMFGRPLLNYWARRDLDLYSQPFVLHLGPKVVLMNGQSSSGGDAFPYYFRELGLGPLIGERTWGGLVGISGNPGFVDGGSIAVPQFAFVDSEGNWAVEAEGVSPDIEVLDLPELIARGEEPMIERAVEYLLRELENPQYRRPIKPAGPVRRPPPN
jgi:tricorn protease